jgi:RimJ/RimL family protein N-acetyltransferase
MLTSPLECLTDGVVSLREIALDDLEVLYRLRMDPECRPMFRTVELVPYERHQAMIEEYFHSRSRDCWLIIEVGRKVVGAIALYNFDDEDRTCECGRVVIAPESRQLGYGSRALQLTTEFAKTCGLQKVRCEILSTNTASVKLFQGSGFVITGARKYIGRIFLELTADLGGQA